MIRYFSLGVITVLILFIGVALLLPSGYDVKEQVFINKSSQDIFPYIENLRKWNDWAFKLEEEGSRLKPEYSGPDEGVGAVHTWMSYDGASAALRVIDTEPFSEVKLQMSTNEGTFVSDMHFLLEETENGTLVIWEEKGDFGFQLTTRVIAFIANYDERVSDQYQAALEELKTTLEDSTNVIQ